MDNFKKTQHPSSWRRQDSQWLFTCAVQTMCGGAKRYRLLEIVQPSLEYHTLRELNAHFSMRLDVCKSKPHFFEPLISACVCLIVCMWLKWCGIAGFDSNF